VGVLTAAVLVVSGAYLLLYLYRWEWNRAIVSGLFFLAALITVSTTLVLSSLRRATERLDRLESLAAREAATREVLRRTNAERARRRFAWLEERSTDLQVFIPVLLGAGALLSGISYVLERAAGAAAGTTIDRRTARLLAPDLPLGAHRAPVRTVAPAAGGPHVDQLVALGAPPPPPRRGALVAWAASAAVVAILATGAVLLLREQAQSRPEPGTTAGSTAIVLDIGQRRTPRPADRVAEALWISCRARLLRTTELASVTSLGDGQVEIVVSQGMGPLRARRFLGCLEDATIDLVQADVVSVERRP
jgi:hypothetical protein